jgi:hypothetical protein
MVSAIRKILQAPVFTGVKVYGQIPTANQMSITAIDVGEMQNDFGVEILNTVTAGAETLVWTPNRLTINVQGGVSTITQVLAAAGGVTGTAWGTLAAIAAGSTTVAAMPLTAIRFMPGAILGSAPSSLDLSLVKEGGSGFPINPVFMFRHFTGGNVTVAIAQSKNGFVPSMAYGEKNKVSVTALYGGKVYNEYKVIMQNTVSAGSETIVWTKNDVTISKAATSTVAQVIAAAGGVTGVAWGVIGKAASAALTDVSAGTLTTTAISGLDNYVGGDDAGIPAAASVVVANGGEVNVAINGRLFNTVRISAMAASASAELELNVVSANA